MSGFPWDPYTYPQYLKRGACLKVLDQSLVPSATLSAGTSPGALTVTLSGPDPVTAGFRVGGQISWWDGTAERKARISDITGQTLTLSFKGRATTGLQYNHSSGAKVATNLLISLPEAIDEMLDSGKPVISCVAMDMTKRVSTNREWQPRVMLTFIYLLSATQDPGDKLDTQIWLEERQERAEKDLYNLLISLQDEERIITGGNAYAEGIDRLIMITRKNLSDPKKPMFELRADALVIGSRESVDR